ncbi:hypothetical protein [Peribacillus asahii]|uniref:hypothetical protein n=1 Tax=Peribacillus asahii TaxID=228899 RepID=UPI002079A850|nr:hypothetical protein [Peribacillus asahii]USK62184.1 hypothetical protein LIT37_23695 [Peribacillus asahii]
MEEGIHQIIGQFLRFGQLILVPVCGLIFIAGIVLFFYAFKNPIRKRKAYLFSIFGGIGFLFFTYIPVVLFYFVFQKPKTPKEGQGIATIVDGFAPVNFHIYDFMIQLAEPFILFLFYVGVFFWLLSAKNPQIKRMGMGLVVGSPVLWLLVQHAMDIYKFFV